MLKDKKIVKFLIAIILCFVFLSISIFSVFATDLSITGRSFGDFLLDNLSINIVSSGSSVDLIKSVTTSDLTNYPNGVRLKVGLYDDTVAIYDYIVNLTLTVPDNIAFSTDWFLGSYDIWLKKDSGYSFIDLYSSYRYSSESGQQNSKFRFLTYDSFPALRITYDTQTRGTHYTMYRTSFSVDLPAGQDTLYFYLGNYDMDTVNPDEEILDGLDSTKNSINNSISNSTSKIQSSISDSTSAIKKDNASNTSKVQSSISKTESNLSSSISKTESNIASDIANTETAIKENQDKNTQSQIANDNRLQQKEQDDANNKGASGVGEVGEVIPNDSDGFIDSLGNLVTALNYSGTDCNWELPSVSIPEINGVMPKIKLWDKMEIPFEYWISKIPSTIMTLIRSVLTIALIVYCFKELYSIISYVLTLKGGGASE